MKIYVKKIEGITLPTKKTPVSAGYDVKSTSGPKFVGEQHSDGLWKRIDYVEYETNLYLAPEILTCHLNLKPRSSVSKYNLVLANSVGTIDGGYRGQIFCRFKYIFQPEDLRIERERIIGGVNLSKIYQQGDKIVQMIVQQTNPILFETIEELPESLRNTGGFGSSGV